MIKNKKGFIFIETIVVLMVVILSLTMLLSSYSLVVRRNNINKYYNRPNEVYALYYIIKLGTTDTNNYISPLTEFYVNSSTCSSVMGSYLSDCGTVLSDMNIQYLGIINSVSEELDNPSRYSNGVIEFLKHMQKEESTLTDEGTYVTNTIHYAIGVFKINNKYYYASVPIDEGG